MDQILKIINNKKYYKITTVKPFTVTGETVDIALLLLKHKFIKSDALEDDIEIINEYPTYRGRVITMKPQFKHTKLFLNLDPKYLITLYVRPGDLVVSVVNYSNCEIECHINPKEIFPSFGAISIFLYKF